ncbi:MAG: hypothetical protein IKA48_09495 [Fibrobacter sp.]|nr:hypothetical protein [Fibrobacter sp.]
MEIDKNFPTICLQDVDVTCSECGEACVVDGRFSEVAGDERLNFYKVKSSFACEGTCPHCGNEMELDVAYWKREFMGVRPDGREVCRVFTMWERDESPGCSAESLFGYFETCGPEIHSDDLALDVSSARELVDLLYKTTRDEALLAVGESLKNGNSVESVIPELKRIIDSHDDVLKDKYLGDFLP